MLQTLIYFKFSSTFFAFALPGQFVMAETLYLVVNIFLQCIYNGVISYDYACNAYIKTNKIQTWKYFLLCHFIAVTAWINYILIYKKFILTIDTSIFWYLGFMV